VAVAAEVEREIFIISKIIQRQTENITDAALSLDKTRNTQIGFQFVTQPRDLNVDAPIEDIFVNPGHLKQMSRVGGHCDSRNLT
jgi:hypothetical protein